MKRILKVPVICLMTSMIFTGCSQNKQATIEITEAITQETVNLKAGELVGFREDGVYTFRGIPYATAERFTMPEPVTSYENNKQMALTYGAVAPQAGTMREAGSSPYEFMTPANGTADIPFWFHAVDEIEYLMKGDNENAHNVSSNMANALAAFASTGNPSTTDIKWKAYTKEDHNTMVFDTNTELKKDYDLQLYKLIME
ncbi:carboxylesterase family protein [Amedibacterium intestinale]|uniref:carboxylesterase family protein n=1 Tax=Amedibacterium intestinale TaxID=2583452 RepID=UPI000E1FB718